MIDAPVVTSFVSEVAAVGFADAADRVEHLTGQTFRSGPARLDIATRVGDGTPGAVWFSGVVYTGGRLSRPVPVEIEVSPWSVGQTEIGVRPLSRLGGLNSARANRFYWATRAVLPELISRLVHLPAADIPVPVAVGLAA